MSSNGLKPSEAIRLLYQAIGQAGILVEPRYVAQDLASLRRAHADDTAFAGAVRAIASEIVVALRSPLTHGQDAEYQLSGWRRSKFPSKSGGLAHLRLVFRGRKEGGMEILAFGDRETPRSVYLSAKARL